MDQQGKELRDLLRKLYRSRNDTGDYCLVVSDIAASGERAIRSLVELLDSAHPDRILRAMAAQSLGYLNIYGDTTFDMSEAIPALKSSLTDHDWLVVFHAAESLWSICREEGWQHGLSDEGILTTLLDCLCCDDSDVRLKTLSRIFRWDGDVDRIAPARRNALLDPNPEVRFRSAIGLWSHGQNFHESGILHESGITEALLKSRLASDRFVAAFSLIVSEVEDCECYIPVLIDAYFELDDHLCEGATYEFRHLETIAETLLPLLTNQFSENSNRRIRLAAICSIGSLSWNHPELCLKTGVVPELIRALDGDDVEILCAVIRELRNHKLENETVFQRLVGMLTSHGNRKVTDHRDRRLRTDLIYEICMTLGEGGVSEELAVPLIRRLLDDEDPDVQECAQWALEKFYGLK